MVIPFSLATNYFGNCLMQIQKSNFLFIFYLFIGLLFLTLCVPTYLEQGILSTKYGRPRLLTPFGHPKEAAIIVTIPLILFIASFRKKLSKYTFGTLISFLISSRNILLFWIIAMLSKNRYLIYAVLTICGMIIAYSVVFMDVETLDKYTSLRVGIWLLAIQNSSQIAETVGGIGASQRFGLDSFWVEAFVTFNAIPTLFLFGLFLNVLIWQKSLLTLSMGLAFLATTFFDTGIASTGNLLHLIFFTFIQAKKISGRSE
jgi:hypothetical protein